MAREIYFNRAIRVVDKIRGATCLVMTLAAAAMSAAAGAVPAASAAPAAGAPVIHPNQWPAVQPSLAPDPALESRLTAMIAVMTLEQKVGQVIQPDIASVTPEDLRHYDLGSILNGGNSSPNGDEFAQPSEWLALADRFYDASIDVAHGVHPPTMWGTDAVHGHNNIVGATIFPHNIGLGAARDPNLLRKIGEITAREVRVTGLDWSFGPTLAIVRDIRWGRSYESYSENPEIVRLYAAAMMLGLQGLPGTAQFLDAAHVIASPKHFVGDGGTDGGKDQGDNLSSEAELRDIHAAGYPPAIAAGAQTVMASFSSWHGVRLSAHEPLLTEVLKGRMAFDGFVIGDWNSHASVPGCTRFSCPAALNAGLDVFMAPDSWKDLYANTLRQARAGEIPAARLNDAVRRVLRVKLRAHLSEEGRPSSRPLAGHFELLGSPEHRAVARQAVRESLVMLKNTRHLLPLSPHAHVLVAGDGADNIGKQSGGWTITWQGTGVSNKDFPHGESIYAGIRRAVVAAGGTAELSVNGDFQTHPGTTRPDAAARPDTAHPDSPVPDAPPPGMGRPDVAIVVFGENPYAEFQGDIPTAEYSPGAKPDLELLRKLHSAGIPVVSVFLSGRPLWVNPELNASDAFVAAWLPGTEGGGIADVLFKAPDGSIPYDFHGKLSFSWPRTPQQTAAVLGAADSPLFPYDFGLRYRDNGDLKKLPEDVDPSGAAAIDTRVFFAAGRAGAGWSWIAGPDTRELPRGVGALSDGRLILTAADKSAQEDARLLSWNGAATAWVGLTATSPIDLQRETNGQLSLAFDYKASAPPAKSVALRVDCGGGCQGSVAIARDLATPGLGQWGHLKMPLVCFARAGADMTHITSPFALATSGKLALRVANIRLESGTDGVASCTDGPAFK